MKIVLTINDDKFSFFMELIKNFTFIKADPLDEGSTKEEIKANIRKGVEDLNLIKKGKLKTTLLKEFLTEIPK